MSTGSLAGTTINSLEEKTNTNTPTAAKMQESTSSNWSKLSSFDPRIDKFFSQNQSHILVENLTIETNIKNSISKKNPLNYKDSLFGTHLRSTNVYKDLVGSAKTDVKLINNLNFLINPGELILVLGKPKTTNSLLLQKLVEHKHSSGILKTSIHSNNQLVFTPEMDEHFPHLTVDQTIQFAINCSVNKENNLTEEDKLFLKDFFLELFEMSHTKSTKVGDEFVRGVSGGERKRVSIIESLFTNASLHALDNSTKGLDSSTAFNFVSVFKKLSQVYGKSYAMTLYQGSQNIYNLFDKVLILFNGYQIYYGPALKVDAYFANLGISKINERQTTLELVDLIIDDSIVFEHKTLVYDKTLIEQIPRTPQQFHQCWLNSDLYTTLQNEIESFKSNNQEYHLLTTKGNSGTRKRYTIGILKQFHYCFNRNLRNNINNYKYYLLHITSQLFLAICIGTLFLRLDMTTQGSFSRSSLIFFCLLLYTFMALSEVKMNFGNGLITHRQSSGYSFYTSSIETLSSVIASIPFQAVGMFVFLIVFYFLTNMNANAGNFFAFWLFLMTVAIATYMIFHMIARLSPTIASANSIAGLALLWVSMYASYVIPLQLMHPWFKWLAYLNPIMYGFEALLSIQLHGQIMDCSSVVPSGTSFYNNVTWDYKVCAWQGASLGNDYVRGDEYLSAAYEYTYSHVWRNFGILIGFVVGLAVIEMIGVEWISHIKSAVKHKGITLYFVPTTKANQPQPLVKENSSDVVVKPNGYKTDTNDTQSNPESTNDSSSVFYWKDVSYTLDNGRKLLTDMNGYVKPGEMVALMGGSGAGKTTLLNTLSGRFEEGSMTGEVSLIQIKQLIGYVEQQDILLPELTVRELFLQSAMLRRSANTPNEEKIAYVDYIIDLLGLKTFQDTLVGDYSVESNTGLSLEQRKKVSLGIELVAKPSSVLFVDEPTSGLDTQSAYNIIRVLRNIADSGQGILCTIHQPSPTLLDMFNNLILLQKGGRQVYFGPMSDVLAYFEQEPLVSRKCGVTENVAEYIIDITGINKNEFDDLDPEKVLDNQGDFDWYDKWKQSPLYSHALQQIIQFSQMSTSNDNHPHFQPISYFKQFRIIFRRTSYEFFRNYQYLFAKSGLFIISGLFIGFTFWKTNYEVASLQATMFAVFMVLCCCAPLMHQVQDRCVFSKSLFELRDSKTNSYHWSILPLTQMLMEIAGSIVGASVSYLCFYFTWGINNVTSRAGEFYLNYAIMFQIYYVTLAVLLLYMSPNELVSSLYVSVTFSILVVFCGAMQPYPLIPSFWKYLVYYSSPVTYFLESLLTILFQDRKVECAVGELVLLAPPMGLTCGEYLQDYIDENGGYLVTEDSYSFCSYCFYANGQEFTQKLHMSYSNIWRNFGLFWLYIVFNVVACFVCYGFLLKYPLGKSINKRISSLRNKKK